MSASVVWDVEPDEMMVQIAEDYARSIHTAVVTLCQRYAPEIETWMKDNRVWTDRTTNARQTLHTEVENLVSQYIELIMAHGVTYGINLELDNGGRFAIIGPALDEFTPKIWADVQELLR